MRLPDGLDDDARLREHLDAIDLDRLAGYLEELDPDDQLRVLRLLQHGPQASAEEIDELAAGLYGEAEGGPARP
jgi:hypothetical protein